MPAMRAVLAASLLGALSSRAAPAPAPAPEPNPDVDTRFPYTGPAVPVGDWVNPGVKSNGKGFPRLHEPPAVRPLPGKPKNNVNVISLAYLPPSGMNIHFQTPFEIGTAPVVYWGEESWDLCERAVGTTNTYDRTPPCSEVSVTQCSQFFHDVPITGLKPDTTYYYRIPSFDGTAPSEVLKFKTARAAGDTSPFTVAVLNDMGYTNAHGTHKQLQQAVHDGVAFAWHGGDLSYADDWYSGILPCQETGPDAWPVCYNGTSTQLPGSGPIPAEYEVPLPKGEIANQGGPQGGDMNVIYESNWDLWQQWMNAVTAHIPYMVMPGNHEASCAEFDGPGNILTAYLNDDEANTTVAETGLTYYSCPPSQRNFTAFQNRFRMPGKETGGVSNFWYSFDYGLTHFVSLDGETDFAFSPEYPFLADLTGDETFPKENETESTDSGPFGFIENNQWKDNSAYEQIQWLQRDLAAVDRSKTPWVVAMSHRPMYSSQVSSYQKHLRAAFQSIMLENGVDVYLAGHIHWYERLYPMTATGTIDHSAIRDSHTYYTNPGTSMTHLINGMAGNVESHSELSPGAPVLPITAVLDKENYGFSRMTFHNASVMTWDFILGDGSGLGDSLTVIKKGSQ